MSTGDDQHTVIIEKDRGPEIGAFLLGALVGAGIALRSSQIRLAGMALLALPVAKLFVFDVFLLERGYRVAAFVTLGVLLLGTGLVYQRYSLAIRGFLFGRQT